jgi:hypothetical protein
LESLRSLLMVNDGDGLRELSGLAVPRVGLLEATGVSMAK